MTWLAVAAALVLAAVAAELIARYGLGLGDPPLWKADPEIEYLPLPSRSYRRFGRRIHYNAYSMRCREFPRRREDAAERRVLVVGDSVVHGNVLTDHEAVCTVVLEATLRQRLGAPALVANASAGSWGPPNMLAYLRRYGLFDAEVLVIVLNSGDWCDAPQFNPLDARMPQRRPPLAVWEVFAKYIPKYLRTGGKPLPPETDPDPADVASCLEALREMMRIGRTAGAEVLVALHLKRSEIEGVPERGHHELARVVREAGLEPIQLGPPFAAALAAGRDPYLEGAHPNDFGQHVIAEALLDPVAAALEARAPVIRG